MGVAWHCDDDETHFARIRGRMSPVDHPGFAALSNWNSTRNQNTPAHDTKCFTQQKKQPEYHPRPVSSNTAPGGGPWSHLFVVVVRRDAGGNRHRQNGGDSHVSTGNRSSNHLFRQ
ncbi:hypothetical protein CMUS01_03219 [Colletotrichum musicola]|uniref:Uncharacterized protein n=1 Tax=Colletotrichum musicola TaxID=2175873 RepID=A0A8H6NTR7_9PEZI|nr:hypothetical protein CMUS01_03219 [Colletotrichum musicola]